MGLILAVLGVLIGGTLFAVGLWQSMPLVLTLGTALVVAAVLVGLIAPGRRSQRT